MPRGIARDHEEKRAALRRGAARYFARHGYDRASMTGAARECGVSKALIYHYYDSKQTLLFDILQAHLTDLTDSVDAARDQGLPGLIHAILAAYADADAEHKLQLDALATLPVDMQEPLLDLQRQLVKIMSRTIAAENPGLTGDRLRAVAMSVFGILNWFYMWNRPGKGLSRSEYADLAADFVRGGLTAV
ncbi:TetR family transcriptional regulator [Rhodobacteraceae bacterium F11138]|nr:TetR family transcriptional regulator [Rhodobacteraceae bacterium F11138]